MDCVAYQNQIEDRAKEEVERRVENIKKRLQSEHEEERKSFEEKVRKKLQLEFEDKLISCEKKLHGDYQTSLLSELQKQEELLWSNFDKVMVEKESKHDGMVRELQCKLDETENTLEDLSQQYERNIERTRDRITRELIQVAEKEISDNQNREHEKVKDRLAAEGEECLRQKVYLEEQVLILTGENNEYQVKVQQLLDVIAYAEESYIHKLQEFENREKEQLDEINSLTNEIATFKKQVIELESNHHAEIRAISKRHGRERKQMKANIEELKDEIKIVERVKINNLENSKEEWIKSYLG
jgi:hypothetical protein